MSVPTQTSEDEEQYIIHSRQNSMPPLDWELEESRLRETEIQILHFGFHSSWVFSDYILLSFNTVFHYGLKKWL